MIYRKLFLGLCFSAISFVVFSQGTHFLKLGTNLSHDITDEVNLQIDFRHSQNLGIYFGLGYDYYNIFVRSSWLVSLSPSQWDYPILAYSGPVAHLGYFISFNNEKKSKIILNFLKLGLVYKNLFYKNRTFEDSMGDGYMFRFNRDEKELVYGADLMVGQSRTFFGIKNLFFDWYVGSGIRYKDRAFTVNHSLGGGIPEGAYYTEQKWYPMVLFGVSVAINLKKEQGNKSHDF